MSKEKKTSPQAKGDAVGRVLTKDRMRFYSTFKLGPKRSLTPEGFLVCEDVAVARTGEMLYLDSEVPITSGPDGLVRISRGPDELFSELTILSAVGKPVTLDHPDEFVNPENYRALNMGHMLNIRRGDGIEDDLMLADFLVMDKDGIKAIQEDKIEEVSLGYDADYEEVSPGRGVQRNIVVNHVALVERGRCGPRCAIGDKEPEEMKTKDAKPSGKATWLDRLMKALKTKDEEGVQNAIEEGQKAVDAESEEEEEEGKKKDDAQTADTLNKILAKLKSMDADIQELKKAGEETADEDEEEGKKKGETGDNADLTQAEPAAKLDQSDVKLYTGDSAAEILSRAEILAPGQVKLPTFDGKTTDAARAAALCSCQRRALDVAYQTDAGKAAISPFLGGKTADFNAMAPALVNSTFIGASELMKNTNNGGFGAGKVNTKDFGKVKSAADINKQNREFWDKQRPAN